MTPGADSPCCEDGVLVETRDALRCSECGGQYPALDEQTHGGEWDPPADGLDEQEDLAAGW